MFIILGGGLVSWGKDYSPTLVGQGDGDHPGDEADLCILLSGGKLSLSVSISLSLFSLSLSPSLSLSLARFSVAMWNYQRVRGKLI